MLHVLSIDVGSTSLGFAIYTPRLRQLLAWGVKTITLQHSSYMRSVIAFDEQCCSPHPCDVVVIERQLRHLNLQMGRIEANLEGYYRAKGKRVVLMAAGTKNSSHGLHLPQFIQDRFHTWTAAALLRAGSGILSKSQNTRLNKKKAKEAVNFFLQVNPQATTIQAQYDSAEKQDDMADALLQALAYANVVLDLGPHQPPVIVID